MDIYSLIKKWIAKRPDGSGRDLFEIRVVTNILRCLKCKLYQILNTHNFALHGFKQLHCLTL